VKRILSVFGLSILVFSSGLIGCTRQELLKSEACTARVSVKYYQDKLFGLIPMPVKKYAVLASGREVVWDWEMFNDAFGQYRKAIYSTPPDADSGRMPPR